MPSHFTHLQHTLPAVHRAVGVLAGRVIAFVITIGLRLVVVAVLALPILPPSP